MVKKQNQILVTVTDGELVIIKLLKDFWGGSEAGIVAEGFRESLPRMMDKYEQALRIKGQPDNPLREILLQMAGGRVYTDGELANLAYDCGISEGLLQQIRDCLSGERSLENVHAGD